MTLDPTRPPGHAVPPPTIDVLELAAGEEQEVAGDGREAVVVLLGGRCELHTADGTGPLPLAGRRDVFGGAGPAVYLGGGGPATVRAVEATELAVVHGGEAAGPASSYAIAADEVDVEVRGDPPARREVRTILGSERPAVALLVGETVNEPGGWSSFPPHKHDEARHDETALAEVYHCRFDREGGFGFARLYDPPLGTDEGVVLRHGTTLAIDRGYHTVAGAPGHRLYYLWALTGPDRRLIWRADPDHAPDPGEP